jgi:hypothetical protein
MFSARIVFAAASSVMVAAFSATAVRADAIDGDWCFAAQSLNIQGPRIRTPGGTDMTGDYTRHTFNYVVPGNEPGAGTSIAMQLLSEETMTLARLGDKTADHEVWKRCKPVS